VEIFITAYVHAVKKQEFLCHFFESCRTGTVNNYKMILQR